MVARNLDRGKGLLRPQLDTAPFPNYFLVEPPIYESGVVVLQANDRPEPGSRRGEFSRPWRQRWRPGASSRWRARVKGRARLILAVAAFAVFPLTIRYGRAFQPDAAMMGAVVAGAGLLGSASIGARAGTGWRRPGCLSRSVSHSRSPPRFLLVPLILVIAPPAISAGDSRGLLDLVPALLWYAWAIHLVASGEGSRASADNRSIWLGLLGPSALLKPETLKLVGWFLFVRAFTRLGAGLAARRALAVAERTPRHQSRSAPLAGLGNLGTRCDGVSRGETAPRILLAAGCSRRGRGVGRCLALARANASRDDGRRSRYRCSCSAWIQVRSTWRTPAEWNGLEQAARAVAATVPSRALGGRARGTVVHGRPARLPHGVERRRPPARAAGEWGAGGRVDGPLELVEYYRRQGARYFADLGCRDADLARKGLHDAVRRRYKVIVDRPDVIIADLADSEMHWNAN